MADDELDASRSSVVAMEKKKVPDHLQPNSTLVFSVTVIEAADISPQYSDVFCQFKYELVLRLISQSVIRSIAAVGSLA